MILNCLQFISFLFTLFLLYIYFIFGFVYFYDSVVGLGQADAPPLHYCLPLWLEHPPSPPLFFFQLLVALISFSLPLRKEFSSFYCRDLLNRISKLDKLEFTRIFLHSLNNTEALTLPQSWTIHSWGRAGKNMTIITKKLHTKHDYKEWFCGMWQTHSTM